MTDFPNPFERETVPGHEFEVPSPIEITNRTIINKFVNDSGRSLAVLLFEEGGEVPDDVAQWLHYRSYTDGRIMTQTADDRYRFNTIEEIKERFLKDQNGRRLYCAVDEQSGELSGVVWLHAIEGGESGAPLLKACETHNEKQLQEEDKLDPTKLATLASRVYMGARHTGSHTPLLLSAIDDYYHQWPQCEGIIIRMSMSDVNAVGAFSLSNTLKDYAQFTAICHDNGVAFMLNRGLTSPEDAKPWIGRSVTGFEQS